MRELNELELAFRGLSDEEEEETEIQDEGFGGEELDEFDGDDAGGEV